MSDDIPFEIQVEIMKRLPVKFLIQLRSVSKTWKSLIDSSNFVTSYSCNMDHMFLKYDYFMDYNSRYFSVDDDDTFPLNIASVTPPCFLVDQYEYYRMVGSSHGLLCFYAAAEVGGRVVLWNPTIRRVYDVVPNVENGKIYDTVLGFGVSHETKDPMIVNIRYVECDSVWGNLCTITSQVEVFTLSTGTWRSLSSNPLRKYVIFRFPDPTSRSVVADALQHLADFRSENPNGGLGELNKLQLLSAEKPPEQPSAEMGGVSMSVEGAGGKATGAAIGRDVGDNVGEAVDDNVGEAVDDNVGEADGDAVED
ncbi:putative F-box protein At1g47790 [Bidens hawaiensis]|uniref:putative F-box protein At1g47790 n=1 Tax=Bidens hawaiensis TaxID=980011 RepID=UPI00404B3C3A